MQEGLCVCFLSSTTDNFTIHAQVSTILGDGVQQPVTMTRTGDGGIALVVVHNQLLLISQYQHRPHHSLYQQHRDLYSPHPSQIRHQHLHLLAEK